MNGKSIFTVSREKHLDHLVRVVPLIVLGYAVHSYVLMTVTTGSHPMVLALGSALIGMILGFVAYDNFHKVEGFDDHLNVQWFLYNQKIKYDEISDVLVAEDARTFATVTIHYGSKKSTFYFVDDAMVFKAFINSQRHQNEQLAA